MGNLRFIFIFRVLDRGVEMQITGVISQVGFRTKQFETQCGHVWVRVAAELRPKTQEYPHGAGLRASDADDDGAF